MDETRLESTDVRERDPSDAARHHLPAGFAHEFRTPLNAILGFGDLLLKTRLTDEQHRYADAMREAGATLLGLLDDLLQSPSGSEPEQVVVRNAPFLLYGVVGGCVAAVEWDAEAKGLELSVQVEPSVPIVVQGDARQIGRVLEGLLTGAVQHAGRGRIGLDVTSNPDRPGHVLFRISWNAGDRPDEDDPSICGAGWWSEPPVVPHGGQASGAAAYQGSVEALGGGMGFAGGSGEPRVLWFEIPLPEAVQTDEDRTTPG